MLKAFGKYTEFSSKPEENKIDFTVAQESLCSEIPDSNKESENVISGEDIETSIKEVRKELKEGEYIPADTVFAYRFLQYNDEDTLNYIVRKKKKIKYIDMKRACDCVLPDGKCIGYVRLINRNIPFLNHIGSLETNKRSFNVYSEITADPVGYIPVLSNEGFGYLVLCKKHKSIADIVFPFLFVLIILRGIMG